MIFSDNEMKEFGRSIHVNIHNISSLIRALKNVSDILQTEEAFTVEYKHTHTHTHTHTHKHTHTLIIEISIGNIDRMDVKFHQGQTRGLCVSTQRYHSKSTFLKPVLKVSELFIIFPSLLVTLKRLH